MTRWTWHQVVEGLVNQGIGAIARVDSHRIEHPRDGGLTQTFGIPNGQRATFRASLTDGSVLSVEDFTTFYEARLERAVPSIQPPAQRVSSDDTFAKVLGLSALGALVGLALGENERSAMTGALVGSAVGLGRVAVAEAESAPAASKAALELAETFTRAALASSSGGRATATVRRLPAARTSTKMPRKGKQRLSTRSR